MSYHFGVNLLELIERTLDGIADAWDADRAEGNRLDFKETPETAGETRQGARKRFREQLAETAVCFANGAGGAIVVGVRTVPIGNGTTTRAQAFAGVPDVYRPDDFVADIHAGTSPSITVQPHELFVEGVRIIALLVQSGTSVHSTSRGVYKIRVGNSCRPLEGEDLRGLRSEREHYDWTALDSGFGERGLSRAAIERASALLRRSGHDDLAALADRDPMEFCSATRLLVGGNLSRAAVLLYGTAEALRETSPNWGINVQTRRTPGGDPDILLRHIDTDVPLVILLENLLVLTRGLISVNTIRVGAEQVELVDYPQNALREILANAFAHRDWEAPGAIELVHSPDELVVTSPGGLLPTLRVDRLLHDAAASRNRLLAENMSRLRLAEMSGLGLDRAFREISRLGKELPVLFDGPRFRVVLPGGRGDEAFARFIHGPHLPEALAGDVDALIALTALRASRSISAASLSNRVQRGLDGAERVLRRMQKLGILQPTRGTVRRQYPNYALAAATLSAMRGALHYRADSIDVDDQKILRHLERHSRISNEDVRNYLDCDIPTARNRLSRLRKRGLIEFAPDSPSRGPNVVYALSRTAAAGPDGPAQE